MALEEKKNQKTNQKPFNEDIVPHFTFLSSAYVKGLSRVLTHYILENFPSHVEKSTKTGYTFTGQDTEVSSVYFVLQIKSPPGFLQIPVFSTCSLLLAFAKSQFIFRIFVILRYQELVIG